MMDVVTMMHLGQVVALVMHFQTFLTLESGKELQILLNDRNM